MPDWRSDIRTRLSAVRLSPTRETEIVDELSQHLDDRWRDLVSGGVSSDEATRLIRAELSDESRLASRLTPLRQARWNDLTPPSGSRAASIGGITADLRQAVRGLRAAPSFTIGALLLLALGIGATTAIFSVADAVVFRSLPFDGADRIVAIGERIDARARGRGPSPPGTLGRKAEDPEGLTRIEPQNYLDWAAGQRVFESMAAVADLNDFTLNPPGAEPIEIVAHRTTASFFDVLRVRPTLGRLFTEANEVDGSHRVALLSDAFWRRQFGADPSLVGRTIAVNGEAYEVVGVMSSGFSYPVGAMTPADIWVPYVVPANQRIRGRGRSVYLQSVGRLKDGVSMTQAQAQMDQVASAIAEANPSTNKGGGIGVRLLSDHLVGASTRSWLTMLLGAAGLVLLIACTNVATLWLARCSARERDVAVRAALGASRWRLVRQFLVETLVVSATGAALGIVLAWLGMGVLRTAMPEGLSRAATISVDLRVLAVAAVLALTTGLLSGIVPALQASRPDLVAALNQSARGGGTGRGRARLRGALVVMEIALAVVLLVGGALFLGSFVNVMRVELGFQSDRVLTMQIAPRAQSGPDHVPDIGPALAEILDRLRAAREYVDVAAVSPGIPLRVNMSINALTVPGRVIEGDTSVSIKAVTPAYYRALTIPLRRGRLFDANDRPNGPGVAILSDAAARAFFSGDDPVGQTIVINGSARTVVGVVGNVRQFSLELNAHPEVYLPMTQSPSRSGYLVLRTREAPSTAVASARTVVASVLPREPIRYVATMSDLIAAQTAERRMNMLMFGLFGALGVVVSAVGVFSVMAYAVAQRTREVAVRVALGATRARVVAMVFSDAARLVVTGLVIGGGTAWYVAEFARPFLFGLDVHDARLFGASAGVLLTAAFVASVLPALRAARIHPTAALGSE